MAPHLVGQLTTRWLSWCTDLDVKSMLKQIVDDFIHISWTQRASASLVWVVWGPASLSKFGWNRFKLLSWECSKVISQKLLCYNIDTSYATEYVGLSECIHLPERSCFKVECPIWYWKIQNQNVINLRGSLWIFSKTMHILKWTSADMSSSSVFFLYYQFVIIS